MSAAPGDGGFLAAMVAAARARARRLAQGEGWARPAAGGAGRRPRLADALRRPRPVGAPPRPARLALMAEVKRRSPSAGALAPGLDAAAQARAYAAAGADAVSVLTEPEAFGGSLADLAAAAEAVDLPLLCKDFVVDPVQVAAAGAAGASAVLLVVAALGDDELAALADAAAAHGLEVLPEAHDERDLERALRLGTPLVAVNNRDLRSLAVDLATTARLAPLVPADRVLVSASGVAGPADAARLAAAGADALLVGSRLVAGDQAGLAALVAALKAPPHEGGARPAAVRPAPADGVPAPSPSGGAR